MSPTINPKPLTRLQKKALCAIELTEICSFENIRAKAGVKPHIFDKWLQSEHFCEELNRRLQRSRQYSSILLACSMPRVITRLNDLLYAQDPETIRKSCADYFKVIAEAGKRDAQAAAREKNTKPAPPEIITDPEQVNRAFEAVFGKGFGREENPQIAAFTLPENNPIE